MLFNNLSMPDFRGTVMQKSAQKLGTALLVLLCGAVLAYVVYQKRISPLAKIRRPFWASLTPLWKLRAFTKGNFRETILDLHQKYGKIVRIGPTEVIVADGSAIRQIYSSTEGKDFYKTSYYDAFTAFRPTIFGQQDPYLHANRRRIVSHGYSMSALLAMEGFVQDHLGTFLTKMEGFARSEEAIDLGKWCHFFAFDVIGELAFSEGFGMMESGVENEHISLINNQMEFGSIMGMVPPLLPYTKWTFLPIPWLQRLQAGRSRLKQLTSLRVDRRMTKTTERRDIIGRLSEAKDPVTGQKLDQIDIQTEAFSSIVAGSDSTSSALGNTFYHILGHPIVYNTLTNELRNAFPERNYESDDTPPTYADLGKLQYLQACIKESLRLTPPATINLPRYVPQPGKVIAGSFFPGMTTVGISALPVHLNPEYFGSDAGTFNPQRWITGSDALSVEEMNRYWIPFGIGSCQCIGKNIAMMELVKVIGTLLLYFDIEPMKIGIRSKIPEMHSYFFSRMVKPLEVYIRSRTDYEDGNKA